MDLISNLTLDVRESRNIYQHRVVSTGLPPGKADCPGDHESSHRPTEAVRQTCDGMVDLMPQREQILVVLDTANYRGGSVLEHTSRTKVVARWIKADDEVAREQILSEHLVIAVRIDKDVGERRGRVPDIATPIEYTEQFAYLPIDPGHLIAALLYVDRGVVRLVVHEQHWRIDRTGAVLGIVRFQTNRSGYRAYTCSF